MMSLPPISLIPTYPKLVKELDKPVTRMLEETCCTWQLIITGPSQSWTSTTVPESCADHGSWRCPTFKRLAWMKWTRYVTLPKYGFHVCMYVSIVFSHCSSKDHCQNPRVPDAGRMEINYQHDIRQLLPFLRCPGVAHENTQRNPWIELQ